jgi:hypothetical protein
METKSLESVLDSSKNIIDTARQQMDKILSEAREQVKPKFHEAISGFFEEFTEIQAITWAQYTPYFNDGDECVFSTREVYFVPAEIPTEELEEYGDVKDLSEWEYEEISYSANYGLCADWLEKPSPKLKKSMKAIYNFVYHNDKFFKDIFGDHVKVFITRDGVTVTEYEHD